jgi:NADH dehydrogenase (ubiquinone) Fe-S protein 4
MLARLAARSFSRSCTRYFALESVRGKEKKEETASETIKKMVEYKQEVLNPDLQQRDYHVDREVTAFMKVDADLRVARVEEPNNVDLSSTAGAPTEQTQTRRARIFVPARTAMQSGTWQASTWKIEWDTRERWENPLMGWCSSADPLSNLNIEFTTKEDAIRYCERLGWQYDVEEPHIASWKTKSYGANFAWNKRSRISCK